MSNNSGRSTRRTRNNRTKAPKQGKPVESTEPSTRDSSDADPKGGVGGPSIPVAVALRHLATRVRQGKLATDEIPASLEFATKVRDSKDKTAQRDRLRACELIRAIAKDGDDAATTLVTKDLDMGQGKDVAAASEGEEAGSGPIAVVKIFTSRK